MVATEARTTRARVAGQATRGTRIEGQASLYRLVNLSGVLRPELEEKCRQLRITGYSRMNKDALKEAIIQKLFYDGEQATVEFESLNARYECSQATEKALKEALGETVPGNETLILALFSLLDDALTFKPPTTIPQRTVIDKLRDAKRRYNWCGSADSCVRDMGIDVGRGPAYYEGLSVEMDTVKRIAQDYANRSGFTNEVNTLLREMDIPV